MGVAASMHLSRGDGGIYRVDIIITNYLWQPGLL
jgi:hypothetical protein